MVKPEAEFPNLYWNLCWRTDYKRESSGTNGRSPKSHMSKEDVCLLLLAPLVNHFTEAPKAALRENVN